MEAPPSPPPPLKTTTAEESHLSSERAPPMPPANERTGPITASEMDVAFRELSELQHGDNDGGPEWKNFCSPYSKDGMTATIVRRKEAASGCYEYRATGTIPSDVETFVKSQTLIPYRLAWDKHCPSLELLQSEEECGGAEVAYWEVAFPTPLSNRDYVFYRRLAKREDSGAFVYCGRQCPRELGDKLRPPSPSSSWIPLRGSTVVSQSTFAIFNFCIFVLLSVLKKALIHKST